MTDDDPPTIWMRSLRWHTYQGQPQPEGSYYMAHAPMVETIESVLKFAVQDVAPMKAVRAPLPDTASAPDAAATHTTDLMAPRLRRGKVMKTTDMPVPPRTA